MADASHRRLKRTLLNITKKGQQQLPYTSRNTVNALIDAWSIIDNVNRLRKLLENMHGIVKRAPGRIIFMNNTAKVKNLRDIIQHLNTKKELETLIQTKSAALGSLTWTVAADTGPGKIYSCYLRPGVLPAETAPFPIHAGNIQGPIDKVTLSIGKEEVCLSDTITSVAKLASSIEKSLKGPFKDLPPASNDVFVYLEIALGEPK